MTKRKALQKKVKKIIPTNEAISEENQLEVSTSKNILEDDGESENELSSTDEDVSTEKDEERHHRLLHLVSGLVKKGYEKNFPNSDKKKRKVEEITELADEHEWNVASSEKLTLSDLVVSLKDSPSFGDLKKNLVDLVKTAPLEPPAPKAVAEREQRKIGYQETSKEISMAAICESVSRKGKCLVSSK